MKNKLQKGALLIMFSTMLLVVVLDQLTKALILSTFSPGQNREIVPGIFNLVLHFNPGAAFGLFADHQPITRYVMLSLTTAAALGFVVYFLFKDYHSSRLGQGALALILGGALGNVIDRLRFGKVVDFLDFYWRDYHWPAFNVADSAICLGVALLIFFGNTGKQTAAPPGAAE